MSANVLLTNPFDTMKKNYKFKRNSLEKLWCQEEGGTVRIDVIKNILSNVKWDWGRWTQGLLWSALHSASW